MKIRIFTDQDLNQLQVCINRWLAEHPSISITQILQSESMAHNGHSWITITFIYIGE